MNASRHAAGRVHCLAQSVAQPCPPPSPACWRSWIGTRLTPWVACASPPASPAARAPGLHWGARVTRLAAPSPAPSRPHRPRPHPRLRGGGEARAGHRVIVENKRGEERKANARCQACVLGRQGTALELWEGLGREWRGQRGCAWPRGGARCPAPARMKGSACRAERFERAMESTGVHARSEPSKRTDWSQWD